jgi:hypothetical protein
VATGRLLSSTAHAQGHGAHDRPVGADERPPIAFASPADEASGATMR